ncbi:MAG: ATP-binding cassette domain-containing protein [Cyclobacteriaceae bacterium]
MSKLEVDSVQLIFGERLVLGDVYLSVETGRSVGLLGRNGTGKSCLLKIIFGVLKGQQQSVRIDGHYYANPFQSGKVVLLPQQGYLLKYLSISQTMKYYNVSFDEIGELMGIKLSPNQKIGELSQGNRKMFELCLLIKQQASFMLLDEPFSSLSPVMIDRMIEILEQNKENKGIILTDHQYGNVIKATDEQYLISDQTLRPITSIQDLIDRGYLKSS